MYEVPEGDNGGPEGQVIICSLAHVYLNWLASRIVNLSMDVQLGASLLACTYLICCGERSPILAVKSS
jgi:hypothetical protein